VRNFQQAGSNLTIPAPAAVSSGEIVIAGSIIGVAAGAAALGASVDVVTTGVFELVKVGADAFTLGALVYYDAAGKLATTTATANTKIGVAVAAAGAGAATVSVRLSGF
jgi:predicted RecA/RadA family phage recombinase